MDESDGLENRYRGNSIVGSNPTPSAIPGTNAAPDLISGAFHTRDENTLPLALAAGQWGWGSAITGSAVISLSVTAWFALVRPSAPKINRREVG